MLKLLFINIIVLALLAFILYLIIKEARKSMFGVMIIYSSVPLVYFLFVLPLIILNTIVYFKTHHIISLTLMILTIIGFILPIILILASSRLEERNLKKIDKHYKKIFASYIDEFKISWFYEDNKKITIIIHRDLDETDKLYFQKILHELGYERKTYFYQNLVVVNL